MRKLVGVSLVCSFMLLFLTVPGFVPLCTADVNVAPKLILNKAAVISADKIFGAAGSKIPADHDDIMGIDVKKTGAMDYEVQIEYALVNYSEAILAAAMPMQDGHYMTGSYLPTSISPGKGRAIIKIVKAPDPFNQVEIKLYKKEGAVEIFSKRFDYAENDIIAVTFTKKTNAEYAVDIQYRLSAGFDKGLLSAFPLQNGQEVMGWSYSPEIVKPGEGHGIVTVKWIGTNSNPAPFNQFRGRLSAANQQLKQKIIDLNAGAAAALDSIKSFSVLGSTIDSLNFKVDYVYGSDQGSNVKLAAYLINGGYPIDWIKCSQPYAQKGSGTMNVTCNFGNAMSMPPGLYEIPSNLLRVQLVREGSNAPIVTRNFSYQKIWSLDDLRNLRVTKKTSSVLDFLVDYTFATNHGPNATVGAKAIVDGVTNQMYIQGTSSLSKGNGTFAGKLAVPPGGKPIQQIYLFMYTPGGGEFYGKVFNYPVSVSAAMQPSAAVSVMSAAVALSAQATSATQVLLKWAPKQDCKEYRIERKNDQGQFFTVATIPATKAEYTDTGLMPSKVHVYRVQAVCTTMFTSREVTVKTPEALRIPGTR